MTRADHLRHGGGQQHSSVGFDKDRSVTLRRRLPGQPASVAGGRAHRPGRAAV